MKNILGVLGLIVAVSCVGWSIGSGELDMVTVALVVVSWFAIAYSCIED